MKPETDWNSVLDTGNVFKLYYCLQIVDALLQGNNNSNGEVQYRDYFITCGGLTHMMAILMRTDFIGSSSTDQGGSKKLVCLALVLRITTVLLADENERLRKGISLLV